MPKVSVLREVTDLTGTELLAVYEQGNPDDKAAARTELARRLDPPPKKKPTDVRALLKGRK